MTSATTFGAVTVARVREWLGPLFSREQLLPDSDRRHWRDNASWLVPDIWSPDTGDAWTYSRSFASDGQQTMCGGGGMANATIIERL
jgi:hypothetical protein